MRTKTLLSVAAVLAAGLAASVAQTVYSVNAVGYVNVPLSPGFNLIANPLNATNNKVNTIIPSAPDGATLLRWSTASQGFTASDTYIVLDPMDGPTGWYDSGFNFSTATIDPGEGFFIRNPTANTTNITFVGDVPQGPLTNAISSNFGFYSSKVPQSASLTTMGFVGNDGLTYTTWNPVSQGYASALTWIVLDPMDGPTGFYDGGFNFVPAVPGVAQGFLITNPGGTIQWGRTFSVN